MAGSRVLVTGGDGLIGAAVVRALAEEGAEVTVYDLGGDDAAARAAEAGARAHLTGSVTDAEAVGRAVADQDAVVHLAGRAGLDQGTAEEIYRVNALGTFLVLQAAALAGVGKLVYASSINASGLPLNPHAVLPSRYPWGEDEPAVIADAYSLSKEANEAAARALARRHGLPLTGLRYPLVRDITVDDGAVFARHVRRALREDPRRQACEGWTYLDVRDAAAATVAALTHETPAAPGILVAAPRTYLRQDTDEALQRSAPEVPREQVPGRDVPVDLHRAVSLLGFKATLALEDLGEHLLADLDDLEEPAS
ncbi:NAD-dependent epimerase/dehydratase family protein [Modestobacter excelsi]|uniref:NAD-dependent epimerase/dehydratase family protein n=1 Tax=Modestobacter excelsi TaxID=2213161 RepID=UPI001C20D518|nr:NAD(P)-dependent oxidoreductase [Modestobacter excelsi]